MSDPFHKFGFGQWLVRDGELSFEPLKAQSWESHFGIHFTPIIFLVVPFYLIFDGPLFLLYLQVLMVGLSAIPLYLIAKNAFKEKYIPVIIAIVYLFFRHLLIGLMHDIHMEMYFPLFIFSSYYFIAVNKKPLFYFLFISLALFIKEDIAVYMFFFGLFIFFKVKEKKYGLITSVYALLYFLLALGVIIPYFRSLEGLKGPYVYEHIWGRSVQNFAQMVWNFLTHPGTLFEGIPLGLFLRKFSNIVSPLLLLPFFSSYVLLAFPPLLAAIVSKNPQIYTFGIHYSATLLPFIFLALIYGLKNIKDFFEGRRKGRLKKAFLVILVLLLLVNLPNSNFWRIIRPSRYSALKDYKQVKQLINQIPKDASVAALSAIIPHIPKRKNIHMLPEMNEAEYILVHSGINLWPYKEGEFLNFLKRIEREKKYTCVFEKGKIKLFRKAEVLNHTENTFRF